MGGLEEALPSLSGVEFKLLFFISARSRLGQVVERVTEIARAIGADRKSVRRSFAELMRMGFVSGRVGESSVHLPEPAETETAAADTQHRPTEDYVTLWDHLRTFQKTIREPLKDWVVQKCMEVGRGWGAMNGRQVAAVLHKAFVWLDAKAGKVDPPRKWIYLIEGLRREFERQANESKMDKRAAQRAQVDRRPADISTPKLAPTREPMPDMDELANLKSLRRAVGAL